MPMVVERADNSLVVNELGRLLADFLPEGDRYVRRSHLDELYEAIPRDPQVRVAVSTVQIGPGMYNDYHLHNGTAVYMVLQGKIVIEFPTETRQYEAGDAYIEPIGVIHRAFNPDPAMPATFVGFLVTATDREHITLVPGYTPTERPAAESSSG